MNFRNEWKNKKHMKAWFEWRKRNGIKYNAYWKSDQGWNRTVPRFE